LGFAVLGAKLERQGQSADEALVGTPDQLIEKIQRIQRLTSAKELVFNFRNSVRVPLDECVKSMKLFAKEVLPAFR